MTNTARRSLRQRGIHVAVAVSLGLCGLPAVALGQEDVPDRDLARDDGIRADGATASEQAGWAVADAGDVNDDGLDDVIVGARYADNEGLASGSAYVLYGRAQRGDMADLDLAEIETAADGRGFRIDGAAAFDTTGTAVAAAGDVNGDGLDDVIVGAPSADNNGRDASGSTYVIYGHAGGGDVPDLDLADIAGAADERGFRIAGAAPGDVAGNSVAGAGDVSGDGRDDVIVGARGADNDGRGDVSGSAYVIYGQGGGGDVPDLDLAELANAANGRGFRIGGAAAGDSAGASVARVGDVSGDGRDDVIVGAPTADNNGRDFSGSAYVIYGHAGGGDVPDLDLAQIASAAGGRGFRVDGAAAGDHAGASVAGADDVNGDGHDDAIVGVRGGGPSGRPYAGSVYALYGQPGGGDVPDLDLADLPRGANARGFRIDGAAAYDEAGNSVAGAGDVNGDGAADVTVGAAFASNNGRGASGSAYVVYGEPGGGDLEDLDLAEITGAADERGFRIDGAAAGDLAGHAVGGAGDVNGDGRDDVIVGARWADNNDRPLSGSAYVLLSPLPPTCKQDATGRHEQGPVSGPVHGLDEQLGSGPAGAAGRLLHDLNCDVIAPAGL